MLFISYESWQKRGARSSALCGWLIPPCFDARLADASWSADSRFWSIFFIQFRLCCNYKQCQISGRSLSFWRSPHYSNGMSWCSRWPVGDRGPARPLGPMHSVTPHHPPQRRPWVWMLIKCNSTQTWRFAAGEKAKYKIVIFSLNSGSLKKLFFL